MIIEVRCTQCDLVIQVELNENHGASTPRIARKAVKESAREHRRDTGHVTGALTEHR